MKYLNIFSIMCVGNMLAGLIWNSLDSRGKILFSLVADLIIVGIYAICRNYKIIKK
jgi:hypothetical protein